MTWSNIAKPDREPEKWVWRAAKPGLPAAGAPQGKPPSRHARRLVPLTVLLEAGSVSKCAPFSEVKEKRLDLEARSQYHCPRMGSKSTGLGFRYNQRGNKLWKWIAIVALTLATGLAAQQMDPNFAPVITKSGATIQTIALAPNGKVYVAGSFCAVNGKPHWNLVRLNVDGTPDESFRPAGSDLNQLGTYSVVDMAADAEGNLLVACIIHIFG